jgi:chorismate mutase
MPNYNTELKNLREQIDVIDDQICAWLAARIRLSQTIGHLKVERGVTEMSEKRKEKILKRLKKIAIEKGIPNYLLQDIYKIILEHSVLTQNVIIYKNLKDDE